MTRSKKKEIRIPFLKKKQSIWDDVVTGKNIRDELQLVTRNGVDIGEAHLSENMQLEKQRPGRIIFGQHKWVYVALGLFIFIFAVLYFWITSQARLHHKSNPGEHHSGVRDVLPGGDVATLQLADGSTIPLGNVQDGILAQEGRTRIEKTGGRIVYRSDGEKVSREEELRHNTVITPRGGQYSVILPDNTAVWLNNVSSLRFPNQFPDSVRRVALEGEGYFEISASAQNSKKIPFIITIGNVSLRVLEGHVNVNSYSDEEAMSVTVLDGSVTVLRNSVPVLVTSGEKATVLKAGAVSIKPGNLQQAIAWKNGLFQFTGMDIRTIMRQLERWYDVQVEFSGKLPTATLSGEIPRNRNLLEILKLLEISGVKSRIDGRRVIVLER